MYGTFRIKYLPTYLPTCTNCCQGSIRCKTCTFHIPDAVTIVHNQSTKPVRMLSLETLIYIHVVLGCRVYILRYKDTHTCRPGIVLIDGTTWKSTRAEQKVKQLDGGRDIVVAYAFSGGSHCIVFTWQGRILWSGVRKFV